MFNSMSVSTRLKLSFGLLIVLMMFISLLSVGRIQSLGADLEDVAGNDMQILQRTATLQVAMLQMGNLVRDAVAQEDLKVLKDAIKGIEDSRKLANETLNEILRLTADHVGHEKASLDKIAQGVPALAKEVQTVLDLVDGAEYDAAKKHVIDKVRPLQSRVNEDIAALFHHKTEEGNTAAASATTRVKSALAILIVLTVIGVVAGGGLALVISKGIVNPLKEAVEFARRVSGGDLMVNIATTGKDEVGELVLALDNMRRNLAELIGRIHEEGSRVGQLARDLSSRTGAAVDHVNVQNERIMAVSAAMEQMSVSVSAVSDSAAGVSTASNEAQELTRAGNQVMQNTLREVEIVLGAVNQSSDLIRELAESVENIRGMANVIKEIADQTNLLALNAAIEAARAGEQGRGFAVVADEVRKLAERTGASTADIANKVNEISSRTSGAVNAMGRVRSSMEADVDHSRSVGLQLQQILIAAEKVTALAKHIADASREQAAGSQQTARNVEEIANISEETSEAIREAGKSAAEMSQTAENLQQLVSRFRLG